MAQGAPTEMTDSAGNKIELIRNPQRNLLEIKGPSGASIKLAYDDYDRIVRAENSQGAWTNYAYNSAGLVMDVVHSDRTERRYSYEGGLLTSVRDEQNLLLIQNTYGNLTHFLSQQQFGNGDTIVYRYDFSPNGKFSERTHAMLPDGTVKVIETGETVSDKYKKMP
jgi:YD repeat-containing protein